MKHMIAAVPKVVVFFTSVTHISGRDVGAASAAIARLRRGRKLHLYTSNITNDSTFLAFVISEPDVENEKAMIKEVLEGSNDPHRRLRDRAGSWLSRLPTPRYAPFWSQFRALLRTWVAMKWYDPKIMQSLVTTIKGPIDQHHHHNNRKKRLYGTCAVVGNSGILLNSTFGKMIDAHEEIVRLNNARIKGFEKYVGGKTTIVFMNNNILHKCARRVRCYCHPYGDNISIVMYVSQVPHLMDMAMCNPVHAAPLLVTDPCFDALTSCIAK
uniref:Uncharacterized protein n=2 Tax=Physcomitrium patens TaxID=3218 RepID=A0A7I4B390_PHYPA